MSGLRMTGLLALAAVTACGATSDKPAAAARASNEFNADSAMSYIRQQLAFGPRVPGTEPARKTGDWIVAHLHATADTVLEQRWTHTLANGKPLPMRNIFARFKPNAKERILYLTHWDTRPVADMESDPVKAGMPIPGANDGASGVALLLAVSDALKKAPPGVGVDLLFVDGEDYGTFGPPRVDVLIGADYYAQHPVVTTRPLFAVLWDMVGHKNLQIPIEQNSQVAAPDVVEKVWGTAESMGYGHIFVRTPTGGITDDHIPLIDAGMRVVDIIDISNYPYWHTLQDTPDKESAQSLEAVGNVAVAVIRRALK